MVVGGVVGVVPFWGGISVVTMGRVTVEFGVLAVVPTGLFVVCGEPKNHFSQLQSFSNTCCRTQSRWGSGYCPVGRRAPGCFRGIISSYWWR